MISSQLLLADGEGVKVLIHIAAGRRWGACGKTSGDSCTDVRMTDVWTTPPFLLSIHSTVKVNWESFKCGFGFNWFFFWEERVKF